MEKNTYVIHIKNLNEALKHDLKLENDSWKDYGKC